MIASWHTSLLLIIIASTLLPSITSYSLQKVAVVNQKCLRAKLNDACCKINSRYLPLGKSRRLSNSFVRTFAVTAQEQASAEKYSTFLTFVLEQKATHSVLLGRLEVFTYLSLWYFFSAVYNIYNKKALNSLGLPWFVATVQMGTGLLLFTPLWLLKFREFPASSFSELMEVFGYMKSVALYQTLTHISGVIALGSGVVSFTQVVKASEPVFTAGISAVFLKQFLPWQVCMTLIPVCIGVAIASSTELTFSWYCLLAGLVANVFAAARGVFGKTQMCGDTSCLEQLSPENYYAILTVLSFFMLLPATALIEGSQILTVLKSAFSCISSSPRSIITGQQSLAQSQVQGLLHTLFSGILFYLYNEVSFKTLNKVHPVTHAVSNTVKRIVIILSSVLVFNTKLTPTGIFGTCLAISGVFLYSVSQHLYKEKPSPVQVKPVISKWASI